MKAIPFSIFIIIVAFSRCSSKEPLPTDVWSSACVQLAPYMDVYRLTGICCSYIEFPKLELRKDRTFSSKATAYNFNGGGYTPVPTIVSGQLSSDRSALVINSYTLKPGYATASCYCACR